VSSHSEHSHVTLPRIVRPARGRQAIEPRLPPQVNPEGRILDLPGDT
jgi:hypothetical protein